MSKKRDDRRTAAQLHIAEVRKNLRRENMDAVATRKRYKTNHSFSPAVPRFDFTEIVVADMDSVSAVMNENGNGRKAVLDFASYHNPGGGYANGAWAQEEALCSESNLYVVLDELYFEYYWAHKNTHNNGLYTADAMYLYDIVFERDGQRTESDVIVIAAPNAKAARSNSVFEDEIYDVMAHRVRTVLDIAADNEVDILIAGAFGCGVFANDPYDVADVFKSWLEENPGVFRKIVFGIPSGGANFDAFDEVFAEDR